MIMAKQRSSTRRALVASGVSILLCMLMLVGTTLAWFTDQASNTGNVIQAGTLELIVIGYDDEGENPVNFKTSDTALIQEINWEPGKEATKYIKVENAGSLDLKFELFFKGDGDTKLAEALWYSWVEVDAMPGGDYPAEADKKAMAGLFTEGAAGELAAGSDAKYYRLDYGMNPCAGNEYQGLDFMADIHVVATQVDPKAKINLDAETPYKGNIIPVFNLEDLRNAFYWVESNETVPCPTIILMNDGLVWNGDLTVTRPFNIDLNGHDLDITGIFTLDINQARGTMGIVDAKGDTARIYANSYVNNIRGGLILNNEYKITDNRPIVRIIGPGNITPTTTNTEPPAASNGWKTDTIYVLDADDYTFTTQFLVPAGSTLKGKGAGLTTLTYIGTKQNSTTENYYIGVSAPNVTISDMSIRVPNGDMVISGGIAYGWNAIRVMNTTNTTLKNLNVNGGSGVNIMSSQGVLIDNVHLTNTQNGSFAGFRIGVNAGAPIPSCEVTIRNSNSIGQTYGLRVNSQGAPISITVEGKALRNFNVETPVGGAARTVVAPGYTPPSGGTVGTWSPRP